MSSSCSAADIPENSIHDPVIQPARTSPVYWPAAVREGTLVEDKINVPGRDAVRGPSQSDKSYHRIYFRRETTRKRAFGYIRVRHELVSTRESLP